MMGCLRTWQSAADFYFLPYMYKSRHSFSCGAWFCLKFYCILILNSVFVVVLAALTWPKAKNLVVERLTVYSTQYSIFPSFRKGLFVSDLYLISAGWDAPSFATLPITVITNFEVCLRSEEETVEKHCAQPCTLWNHENISYWLDWELK